MMLIPRIFGDDFFDGFGDNFPFYGKDLERAEKALYGHRAGEIMKADIKETAGGYELDLELPGFSKDEIKASLENGYLTVSAAKGLDRDQQEKETGRYIRRERFAGVCQRSFYVGEEFTQEDIKGEYRDGVLRLFLPKKEAKPQVEERKYIAIEG